jgi:hypothetical protein
MVSIGNSDSAHQTTPVDISSDQLWESHGIILDPYVCLKQARRVFLSYNPRLVSLVAATTWYCLPEAPTADEVSERNPSGVPWLCRRDPEHAVSGIASLRSPQPSAALTCVEQEMRATASSSSAATNDGIFKLSNVELNYRVARTPWDHHDDEGEAYT